MLLFRLCLCTVTGTRFVARISCIHRRGGWAGTSPQNSQEQIWQTKNCKQAENLKKVSIEKKVTTKGEIQIIFEVELHV